MESRYKSGLTITYDFGTVEDSCNKSEPIYVYKDEENGYENNITMSIEEALWLKYELGDYIRSLIEERSRIQKGDDK